MQDVGLSTSLVANGTDLLVYGMGTVFVFLSILVLATILMSMIVQKFFAEAPEEPNLKTATVDTGRVNPRTLAVIQAAIHEHRAKQ